MLNEYACAIGGTGQRELGGCIAKVRLVSPLSIGGPKPAANVASRVSAIRPGVIATKARALTGVISGAFDDEVLLVSRASATLLSLRWVASTTGLPSF
jgi:hypothetical protein